MIAITVTARRRADLSTGKAGDAARGQWTSLPCRAEVAESLPRIYRAAVRTLDRCEFAISGVQIHNHSVEKSRLPISPCTARKGFL